MLIMNYSKWKSLADEGYSSDIMSFLQFIKDEESMEEEHPKTQSLLSLLNRKQLITDKGLTLLGNSLLEDIDMEYIPLKKQPDKFEEWWKIYPASDGFTKDGRSFMGSQSKRIKKDLCKVKFTKLINSGYEAEDIIKATEHHIDQAKKISLVKNSNQLSFIANSERYLREEMFEPYIGLSQEKQLEFKSNVL